MDSIGLNRGAPGSRDVALARGGREKPLGAPVHQSLTEPVLLMGMERAPALTLFITVAALAAVGLVWYTLTLAGLLLVGGCWALGKLAQYDPQFEAIVLRYAAYDSVYDPEATVERPTSLRLAFGAGALADTGRPAIPAPRQT